MRSDPASNRRRGERATTAQSPIFSSMKKLLLLLCYVMWVSLGDQRAGSDPTPSLSLNARSGLRTHPPEGW